MRWNDCLKMDVLNESAMMTVPPVLLTQLFISWKPT